MSRYEHYYTLAQQTEVQHFIISKITWLLRSSIDIFIKYLAMWRNTSVQLYRSKKCQVYELSQVFHQKRRSNGVWSILWIKDKGKFLFVSKFNKENNIHNCRCYQVNIIFTKKIIARYVNNLLHWFIELTILGCVYYNGLRQQ